MRWATTGWGSTIRAMVHESRRAPMTAWSGRTGGGDLMARSPVLVWRNATRIRLIQAFRAAYGAPEDRCCPASR
jgi:exodeoxyribonuclease V